MGDLIISCDILEATENFDQRLMAKYFLHEGFFLVYNLSENSVYLSCKKLENIPGLKLEVTNKNEGGSFTYIVAYPNEGVDKMLDTAFKIGGKLIFAFLPDSVEHVLSVKKKIEHKLSSYEVRFTKNLFHSGSVQMDLFYKYDERKALENNLNSINEIIMDNALAYKFFILIEKSSFEKLYKIIESGNSILEKGDLNFLSLEEAFVKLSKIDCLPFGINNISKVIYFPRIIKRISEVETQFPYGLGEIKLGHFLENAAEYSNIEVGVKSCSFNLGTIITGVPGTGKSYAAMGIAEQLLKNNIPLIVISPTHEWSYFAVKNKIKLFKIYSSNNFKINFFKSDSNVPIERFYENLAMLLASTSGAGPYKNSLEKVLLSAFHKAYSSNAPDPQSIYKNIEEVVIEQHGKKTNVGIKYTKHGENIMASLENLRLLLSRPEFSYMDGIDFNELLNGVVFDLSNVSNSMKPFFYALILNQVYNIIDSFSEDGDAKLRLEIVLEESHLVFGNDELSGPIIDLKERIQDFRKKGVGIMLITHNTVDINSSIRRLCQTKFYFRQSPDIVKVAANDLGLSEDDASKLKFLGRGISALNYINVDGKERNIEGPIFIKFNNYALPKIEVEDEVSNLYRSVQLLFDKQLDGKKVELYFLSEKIASSYIENGSVRFDKLIKEKEYKILVLGERKKDTLSLKFKVDKNIISFEKTMLPN
ncbi:MAG: ATP-binding protein [Candidatus Micrarchaeia archaeon]